MYKTLQKTEINGNVREWEQIEVIQVLINSFYSGGLNI